MSLRMAEEVSAQVPADDFQALEDKVYRTIELYKAAREARAVAERDVRRVREQLEEREEEVETMRREMVSCARSGKISAGAWKRCCNRLKPLPRSSRRRAEYRAGLSFRKERSYGVRH